MDEFDKAQVHAVGLTTLTMTFIGLLLLQAFSAGRLRAGLRSSAWLVAIYFLLIVPSWGHHLQLALPEVQSILLCGVGATLALGAAVGLTVLGEPASDRAT